MTLKIVQFNMKQKLKTVYIPVKVEDKLPELNKQVFTLNTMIPGKVHYPPEDDGENKNINCRVSKIPNKCEKWYDEYNFGMMYSKVNSWLKKQQLITFTKEEYNQHIQDVIKDALETAADKGYGLYENEDEWRGYSKSCLNKKSITNTFDDTFNKYKL